MILSLDLGNHLVKWWISASNFSIESYGHSSPKNFEPVLKKYAWNEIDEVRIASVRERTLTEAVINMINGLCNSNCVVREAFPKKSFKGLHLTSTDPRQIGIDRYLAMLAVAGSPKSKCLVDLGSALTVDILDKRGCHRGGYIVPGLALSRKILSEETSGINVIKSPLYSASLGLAHNTARAVEHGIRRTVLELVKAVYYEEVAKENSGSVDLILSGGDHGWLISYFSGSVGARPNIVKEGLDQYFNSSNVA